MIFLDQEEGKFNFPLIVEEDKYRYTLKIYFIEA